MSSSYCPLLSIVVPVYNVGGYLLDTLDSIAAQSYNNIEIICVDDGSTDGSGELLDLYAARDSRFAIYHEVNRGVSAARNFGIDKARGEIILLSMPMTCLSLMPVMSFARPSTMTARWIS